MSQARIGAKVAAGIAVFGATVGSAIMAKEVRSAPPLASITVLEQPGGALVRTELPATGRGLPEVIEVTQSEPGVEEIADALFPEPSALPPVDAAREKWGALLDDSSVRWFNGRPVKPARSLLMEVTAYSPDARSCGDSADGLTATLHSVHTNGFELVAADPRLLPYGSMLTIPGYADGLIVPVLDCGGAIKGHKLDVLFPTHEQALKWGRRSMMVTVWEHVDGKPRDNPRKLR